MLLSNDFWDSIIDKKYTYKVISPFKAGDIQVHYGDIVKAIGISKVGLEKYVEFVIQDMKLMYPLYLFFYSVEINEDEMVLLRFYVLENPRSGEWNEYDVRKTIREAEEYITREKKIVDNDVIIYRACSIDLLGGLGGCYWICGYRPLVMDFLFLIDRFLRPF